MTAQRFLYVLDNDEDTIYDLFEKNILSKKDIEDKMNALYEEKEDWKHNCLESVSENSILWNEISILREQGAEPSDAFKNYLNDLKNKNKKLQGD